MKLRCSCFYIETIFRKNSLIRENLSTSTKVQGMDEAIGTIFSFKDMVSFKTLILVKGTHSKGCFEEWF